MMPALTSPWPQASILAAPAPVRFDCPLHAGWLLPCGRCAAWLATRRLVLLVDAAGRPVALTDRGPLHPVSPGHGQ